MADIIRIDAYHGTARAKKDSILRTKKIFKSSKDNEWAGTGIYYFVDEDEKELIDKCTRWALNVKKYKTAAVVKNLIEIDKDYILDLTIYEAQNKFHEYRQFLFDKARQCAKKRNKIINDTYTNGMKLDCLTINRLCSEYKLDMVKRKTYINFYKPIEEWKDYPSSGIPNATIISLRNEEHINDWSGYDV